MMPKDTRIQIVQRKNPRRIWQDEQCVSHLRTSRSSHTQNQRPNNENISNHLIFF
jgi:hypothetical protein